jgi:hypothetical protein
MCDSQGRVSPCGSALMIVNQLGTEGNFAFEKTQLGKKESGVYRGDQFENTSNPGVPGFSEMYESVFSHLHLSIKITPEKGCRFFDANLSIESMSEFR